MLVEGYTLRSVKQNREPRNRHTQDGQLIFDKRKSVSTNDIRAIEHLQAKP